MSKIKKYVLESKLQKINLPPNSLSDSKVQRKNERDRKEIDKIKYNLSPEINITETSSNNNIEENYSKINKYDIKQLKGLKIFNKIYIANNRLPAVHKIKSNKIIENKRKKRSLIMHKLMEIKNEEIIEKENTSNAQLKTDSNFINICFADSSDIISRGESPFSLAERQRVNTEDIFDKRKNFKTNIKKKFDPIDCESCLYCMEIKPLQIMKKEDVIQKEKKYKKHNILPFYKTKFDINKKNEFIKLEDGKIKNENLEKEKNSKNNNRKINMIRNNNEILSNTKEQIFNIKYQKYKLVIQILNLSNFIKINEIEKPHIPYKFWVGKGNNSTLIRSLLKNKWWWNQAESIDDSNINFLWTQLKNIKFIKNCKSENSCKNDLCEKENLKIVKEIKKSDFTKIIHENLLDSINTDLVKNKFIVIENSNSIKIHNHFENNFHLGNKKALFYNMKTFFEYKIEDVFENLPLTFHIRNGLSDKEYQRFLTFFLKNKEENEKLLKNEKNSKNLWIIKPGEVTNRGNGITITNNLTELNNIINSKEFHKNGKTKTYIIQKYIEKPLLYNNRKIDIRCYMLLTNHNKNYKGYWYQEGYIRTSSKEFSLNNLQNKIIHLTNDAVQKKGETYGKFENANKLSFNDFQKYLNTNFPEKVDFFSDIYPQLKKLSSNAMRSVFGKINFCPSQKFCFEIFGLDFMIDSQFKVWLIEINTNPCLELCCPLLFKIIPNMLDNAFRIGLDPIFPPPKWPLSRMHVLPEPIEGNKFEIVFDENFDECKYINNNELNEMNEDFEEEIKSDCEI